MGLWQPRPIKKNKSFSVHQRGIKHCPGFEKPLRGQNKGCVFGEFSENA